MNYFENLNDEVKRYFITLSSDIPSWLFDYVDTEELQRIGKISMNCGTDYSKLFDIKYWYSNLDHSVGVALIIWNFTHDKKQTLAGLFHDIATPVFKHCIDFMNGDSETQESTEKFTMDIIKNSKEIMSLLKRDNISLEEVCDYKIYPIADNNTPKLSSDRFEYNFSSGLEFYRVWDLKSIKECYNDVTVVKNEEGIDELAFRHINICEKYINTISKLWVRWICNEDRIVMQFLADICKLMNKYGYLTINDLYNLSENEVLDKIINCENINISNVFKKFQNTNTCFTSKSFIDGKYCINVKPKRRYINPLVLTSSGPKRIYDVSKKAKEDIDNYFNYKIDDYVYFDFDLELDKIDDYEKNKVMVKKKD